jgi:glutamate-1-semialdehyde 2,1-aminomutase
MTAGKVAMDKLTPAEFKRLDALGESIRSGIVETLHRHDVPGQVTGAGSLFYIHLHDRPLTDYRSSILTKPEQALATRIHRALLANGVFMSTSLAGCLSTPMSEADIATFIEALGLAIEEARA